MIPLQSVFRQRYLSRTITAVVLLVIDYAELAWRHTVDGVIGMDDDAPIGLLDDAGLVKFWRMAYLKRDALGQCRHALGEEVEVVYGEVAFVGSSRVIAMRYE